MKDYTSPSEHSEKSFRDNQLTPAGFNAIRGMEKEEGQPNPDSVKVVVPHERVAEVRTLNSSEGNDLELAAQHASGAKATRWHGETEDSIDNEYYRIRSEIGEELAIQEISNSTQSDEFSVAGTNFPNYDVFSPQEVSSVKVRALKEGKPSSAYQDEFADLVNPDSELNQKAAERLLEIKGNKASWEKLSPNLPSEVRMADSKKTIQNGLSERATLRIPADQVEPVRDDLREAVTRNPAKFGLDANTSSKQLKIEINQLVVSRILPIDTRYDTAHYQAKAAEMIQEREQLIQRRLNL